MSDLTDDELRKQLQAYGEDVGPITDVTRSLWKKRLLKLKSSKIPRKVEKFIHPKELTPDSSVAKLFDSPRRENGAGNRNNPANRIILSSPHFSEGSGSSFDLDYSLVTGEPGNSPYPFRAKHNVTSLEKHTDRRMLDIESLNLEIYQNPKKYRNAKNDRNLENHRSPENFQNLENNENFKNYRSFQNHFTFKKYCELKDKGKILYRFPIVDGEQVCEMTIIRKEPVADSGEEWSDCDEDYFLAENLVTAGRGTFETIGMFLSHLMKAILLVIIVSLCLDTNFFRHVSRGRIA